MGEMGEMMQCGDNLRHVRTKFCQLHTVLVTLHKPVLRIGVRGTPIRGWHAPCIDLPMNTKRVKTFFTLVACIAAPNAVLALVLSFLIALWHGVSHS